MSLGQSFEYEKHIAGSITLLWPRLSDNRQYIEKTTTQCRIYIHILSNHVSAAWKWNAYMISRLRAIRVAHIAFLIKQTAELFFRVRSAQNMVEYAYAYWRSGVNPVSWKVVSMQSLSYSFLLSF